MQVPRGGNATRNSREEETRLGGEADKEGPIDNP